MVRDRAERDGEFVDFGKFLDICVSYGRIDLKIQFRFPGHGNPAQGAFEGAGDLSECVMGFSRGPIETDAYPLNARVDHLSDDLRREQGAVGGHGHPEAQAIAVLRDIENIGAKQRLSARQNDYRLCNFGDFVHHPPALGRGKLPFVGAVLRGGPAVNACEIAGTRKLPGYKAQVRLKSCPRCHGVRVAFHFGVVCVHLPTFVSREDALFVPRKTRSLNAWFTRRREAAKKKGKRKNSHFP